ncbi:hypothetical protein [Nocardiopsis akebiae]|uniref:hypothetical protein n=1 Tax=Nocardiopsis akebiae TaxID=2831968 RepID=UPI0020165833|nr:hypothetical protein [Nocardiopsis akebiae]
MDTTRDPVARLLADTRHILLGLPLAPIAFAVVLTALAADRCRAAPTAPPIQEPVPASAPDSAGLPAELAGRLVLPPVSVVGSCLTATWWAGAQAAPGSSGRGETAHPSRMARARSVLGPSGEGIRRMISGGTALVPPPVSAVVSRVGSGRGASDVSRAPLCSARAGSARSTPPMAIAATWAPADVPTVTEQAEGVNPACSPRAASTPVAQAMPPQPPPPRISPVFKSVSLRGWGAGRGCVLSGCRLAGARKLFRSRCRRGRR